jgi:hypothetical protein
VLVLRRGDNRGPAPSQPAAYSDIRFRPAHVVERGSPPPAYAYGGGQCWQLRQACLHKEELGEEGMGNCRRYRELCDGDELGAYPASPRV